MDRAERRRRRRNARELERRLRALDELDRRYGLGALPGTTGDDRVGRGGRPRRRGRRSSSGLLPGLLVTALVVGAMVVFAPGAAFETTRRLVGLGPERIAPAPTVPGGTGQFAFTLTQRDGRTPVGYDPCRPIRVEVNPEQAPEDWQQLVATAIDHTSGATGLTFQVEGTTEDRDFFARRDRLIGEPPPVLVGWGTEDEFEDLAGDVAGLGGSVALQREGVRSYYSTGSVLLDADAFDQLAGGEEERAVAQAIVDHEFGHLVGLGHVEDPRELMHGEGVRTTTYGPGDLQGLARLGNVPCR